MPLSSSDEHLSTLWSQPPARAERHGAEEGAVRALCVSLRVRKCVKSVRVWERPRPGPAWLYKTRVHSRTHMHTYTCNAHRSTYCAHVGILHTETQTHVSTHTHRALRGLRSVAAARK